MLFKKKKLLFCIFKHLIYSHGWWVLSSAWGGVPFIFELFVTVLLTFNCAERNICCCIHTQMLLSRLNFCHEHMLALLCWTFLSFLGRVWEKEKRSPFVPLAGVRSPSLSSQPADHSASKPPETSWENHCVHEDRLQWRDPLCWASFSVCFLYVNDLSQTYQQK